MSTLLTYAVAPATVYASSAGSGTSIASLTLTVTNNTGADVALDYIDATVPDVLTTAFGSIGASAPKDCGWSFGAKSQGSNIFRAYLTNPSAVFVAGGSIELTLANIEVSQAAGQTAQVTISQKDTSGTQTPDTLPVNLTAPVLSIAYFDASKANVSPGEATTLSWQTAEAATLALDCNAWAQPLTDQDGLPFSGAYPVHPETSTTYTLTITGLGAKVERQFNIGVYHATIYKYTPDPLPEAVAVGQSVEMVFYVNGAGYGLLNPGNHRYEVETQGADQVIKVPVILGTDPTITFKVYDAQGNPGDAETLTFTLTQIRSFSVPTQPVPDTAFVGLTWDTENADGCALYDGQGHLIADHQPVQRTADTPYYVAPGMPTQYQLWAYTPDHAFSTKSEVHSLTYLSGTVKTISVGNSPSTLAVAGVNGSTYLYCANLYSNTVSVIDTGTYTVIRTIAVGSQPQALAVAAVNGKTYVYCVNWASNSISVIDTSTNTVIKTISVGNSPQALAVATVNGKTYVYCGNGNTISVIDTGTQSVIKSIPVGPTPKPLAVVTVNGKPYLYCGNVGANTVSVIDLGTQTVVHTIVVGNGPGGLAVATVNGKPYLYCVNWNSNSVSVIDAGSNTVVHTISVDYGPRDVTVVMLNDTPYIYCTNTFSNSISVIDTGTNAVIHTLSVGQYPGGLAVATFDDITYAYCTNSSSLSISVIDARTHTVIRNMNTGEYPASPMVANLHGVTYLCWVNRTPGTVSAALLGPVVATYSETAPAENETVG